MAPTPAVDAAEDAYADIALTERFQKAFGDYVNAQMRVRAAMQKEVELTAAQWGMPGRSEVDGAYRRIAELEREVRRLREAVESALASRQVEPAAAPPAATQKPASKPAPTPAPKPAAKSAPKKSGKR
ncbi:poly(R)-hydroxyalkanoic acid synthase subunit PhaE [Lysobacter xanthus]